MDVSDIKFNQNTFEYTRLKNGGTPISLNVYKIIIIVVIVLLSMFVFVLDYMEHPFITNIRYFNRIKKNINNNSSYINEKTAIEIEKTKQIFNTSNKQDKLKVMNCYDLGSYYVAAKINRDVFLPEFIVRGDSNIWKISKAGDTDIGAKQFCQHIIEKEKDNTVTCGKDMMEKFGSSDYINQESPCNTILNFMI